MFKKRKKLILEKKKNKKGLELMLTSDGQIVTRCD
jgi:hypothetical protein